ncbi:protein tyrosine phosphatase [Streptomyces antioxidans]|uniref:Protein tyrosine phosphatase n=1 Tax=Streptomyces antioxidans TaxID=1507734 RepID=A0A1V4D5Y8_9ACTN|nr:tyrosine-protein phosphatase [Streptomyces antioxidans]OPF80036.1 protein tyrosine phosphatase [Streptomyces antioxidans]
MTQQSQSPQVPQADSRLVGVRNFRDLGGLPAADGRRVRPGVLFRSGHLAHATEADTAYLDSLGLHTVFDFRNAADIKLEGQDVTLRGVRNVNVPLSDPADGAGFWTMVREGDLKTLRELLAEGRAEQRMIGSYRSIITTRLVEHGRILRDLAEDSSPALMHCSAGKDRAGLSIAVTLLALGVDQEAIETDYLESAAAHRRYKIWRKGAPGDGSDPMSPEVMALLLPLFDARAEYLAAALTVIEETWGGTDRYFAEGLGLAPEQRDRLRDRLLTD